MMDPAASRSSSPADVRGVVGLRLLVGMTAPYTTSAGRDALGATVRADRVRRAGDSPACRAQAFEAIRVGPQRGRNRHAAVGVLIVLQHGDERAADREAGAVERVTELGLAAAGGLVADVGAAAAEISIGGARRDLAIPVLPRQPHLDVVALGRAEADVPRASLHHAIRQ